MRRISAKMCARLATLLLSACGGAGPPAVGASRGATTEACEAPGAWARIGYRPADRHLTEVTFNDRHGDGDPGLTFEPQPSGWRMPEGLRLAVGTPVVGACSITLSATLTNTTDAPLDAYLWDAGYGYLGARLAGEGVSLRPTDWDGRGDELGHPTHGLFRFAPGGHLEVKVEVLLEAYEYPRRGAATLSWELNSSGQGISGEAPVVLP